MDFKKLSGAPFRDFFLGLLPKFFETLEECVVCSVANQPESFAKNARPEGSSCVYPMRMRAKRAFEF